MRRALALLVVLAFVTVAARAQTRPDVVVILADDLGFSDLGCYGSEIPTPNLDALAANGLRFAQFYNTARCSPTRASLMTGLYPHQADMGHLAGRQWDAPGYRNELTKRAPTIAEALKPAGYATYMVGKWHLSSRMMPGGPMDNWPRARGFDRFYGTIQGGGSFYDPAMLARDDAVLSAGADPEYRPERYYYTDAIADHAVKFVREHDAAKPMFLYVAFTAPHWPLHAPDEAVAKYKGKYDAGYDPARAARLAKQKALGLMPADAQLTPAPLRWDDVARKDWEARCMEVYAAQVELMDAAIGRLVAELRERGRLDNTLILFMSDNGGCAEDMGRRDNPARRNTPATQPRAPGEVPTDVFPEHTPDGRPIRDGLDAMPGGELSYTAYGEGWANVSNTPFRLYKHHVHEGGVSTPLVAHWPAGVARKGAWERMPGHVVDVMATCLDVAGLPQLETSGVSLAPLFAGREIARGVPIFFDHESNRAVRDGRWKLVSLHANGDRWELYDMDADRTELRDLATKQPERVKAMAEQWQRWAESTQVLPRPKDPPVK